MGYYDEEQAKIDAKIRKDEISNRITKIVLLCVVILGLLVWIGGMALSYNLTLNFCKELIQEAAANGLSVLPGKIYDVVKEIVN